MGIFKTTRKPTPPKKLEKEKKEKLVTVRLSKGLNESIEYIAKEWEWPKSSVIEFLLISGIESGVEKGVKILAAEHLKRQNKSMTVDNYEKAVALVLTMCEESREDTLNLSMIGLSRGQK